MKKKLVLFCLLLSSLFGFVGCNNDPYKNMTITTTLESSEVQLNITETKNSAGTTIYDYESASFNVIVSDTNNDTDKEIVVSGGLGFVDISLLYKGNGITSVTVKPLSPEKTGKVTLNFKTKEGNKSLNLDFNIDLQLNDFQFKTDSEIVVAKGGSITDLSNLEKYINFYPSNATKKDVTYEVAIPFGNEISGKPDGNYSYEFEDAFDPNYHKYAEIIDNVLVTYDTYLDSDGEEQSVVYPTMDHQATGNAQSVSTKCITLKASATIVNAVGEEALVSRYLDIIVVDTCSKVELRINAQKNSDSVAIEKNKNGEYDIILLDPNYKEGQLYPAYYITRDLYFDLGTLGESGIEYNPNDYIVTTDYISEDSENTPISLSASTNTNSFRVHAQSVGTYSHTFKVVHKTYPGVFDQEIVVNFKVIDIPTSIKINDELLTENDSFVIYDYYAKSYGTRFNVTLSETTSNFDYFVFIKEYDGVSNNTGDISDLHLYKSDGSKQVFAKLLDVDGENELTSSVEGSNYSRFKNLESFYVRHSFESLPEGYLQMCIAISFSMAADSYSDETKATYFTDTILYFPIKISFENGLKEISFTQSRYYLDLTNTNYIVGSSDFGVKLLDLPKGQTVDKCISKLIYDHDLIQVEEHYDETLDTTSLYLKCNSNNIVGETELQIIAKNGLQKSVYVETYFPTAYAGHNDSTDLTSYMPLSIEADKNSTAYLYSMSGKNEDNHSELWTIYKNFDIDGSVTSAPIGEYESLDTLFLIINCEQKIDFYDFIISMDEFGAYNITKANINDKVSISFNYSNYVTYKNGKLYPTRLTLDKSNPVIMKITYKAGYETVDENNNPIYEEITITKEVKIYIYEPLQGVQVTTSKDVSLYIKESLGYFDLDLASHTIKSSFEPNDASLGGQWNSDWVGTEWQPVTLVYKFDSLLNSKIIKADGTELVARSSSSQSQRVIYYRDLFEVQVNDDYTCTITCRLSNESFNSEIGLSDWIEENFGGHTELLLKNIFSENITFVVNVYIQQFNKLQNINSIKFTANFADKIQDLKVDVDDDGVYFEVRRDANGNLITSEENITVGYTLSNADVVNKNLILMNDNTPLYLATVSANSSGNSGVININSKFVAGVEYLTVTTEDNIKDFQNGVYTFYNDSLVKKFRIKVADGSEAYNYEIRTVSDYLRMIEDISNANNNPDNDYLKYYYYTITRDINLSGVPISSISIELTNKGQFSLNGVYTYSKNSETITKYSNIYNLTINTTIDTNKGQYIGLFGALGQAVTIKDVSVLNSNITINCIDNSVLKNIYVGILAGKTENSTIKNTRVLGNIIINTLDLSYENYSMYIGGMIGYASKTTISGLPGSYQKGISSTADNVYVEINISKLKNASSDNILVGGLAGIIDGTTLENLQVVSSIKAYNNGNYGGLIGSIVSIESSKISSINKIEVSPRILVSDSTESSEIANIGGSVGSINAQAKIENTKVYFVNIGLNYSWKEKVNIYAYLPNYENVNVGGFAGLDNSSSTLKYNYVRSFYNQEISDTYKGNIYVVAKLGNIGGLIGSSQNASSLISNSYFDADLVVSDTTNVGVVVGNISSTYSLNNTYGISKVYLINSVDEIEASTLENTGLVGTASYSSNTSQLFDGLGYKYTNSNISYSYAVINENIYYISYEDGIYAITEDGKDITDISGVEILILFENLGFVITQGEDSDVTSYNWFWNSDANNVNYNVKSLAYPILLNNGQAMYDLVPTGISTIINTQTGLYDLSYGSSAQLLMFLNQKQSDNSIINTYYEISLDKDASAIKIALNGRTITTSYIKLDLNDSIDISEDSNGTIIKLDGNKIYAQAEGLANLTISSHLDKTVMTQIVIKVINGITNVIVKQDDEIIDSEEVDVYIDEISNFRLISENIVNDEKCNIATNIGYVLEILDNTNNGILNINNKNYSYDENSENVYVFNVQDFIVKGVEVGKVKVKIIPILYLNDLEYSSTYVNANNLSININKAYVLLDMAKEVTFNSLARAIGIETNISNAKLSPKNSFNLTATIESANVSISNNYDNDEIIGADIEIGEGLKLSFGNYEAIYEINETLSFAYASNKYSTKVSQTYKNELLSLTITSIGIEKTNNNAEGRQNTYKITYNISVSFDRDYYRINANYYDLNSIVFNLKFMPKTNESLNASVSISINPTELSEIFTNYYSQGEKGLGYDEITYPQENESNFIVPNRKGLLKITLDNEFNNSSYIEVTLDNKYKGYVTLGQVSGRISQSLDESTSPDIIAYSSVAYSDEVDTDSKYGIRLSKLSLNYLDYHYFNNTYFVEVYLDKNYNESTIEINITSYKVENENINTQLSKTVSLQMTYLPELNVTIEEAQETYIGQGVKKALDIDYKGIEENIYFEIGSSDNIYIADDEGNKIVNILSIEYLESGRQYYLCVDVEANITNGIEINFKAQEYVLGVLESTMSTLTINIVEYEILNITLNGINSDTNTLEILHGQSYILGVNIEFAEITVGSSSAIESKLAELNKYWSLNNPDLGQKEKLEYSISGTQVQINGINQIENSSLRLSLLKYVDAQRTYLPIRNAGDYENFSIKEQVLNYTLNDNYYVFTYYTIKGTSISDNNILRLSIPYSYENGKVVIGEGYKEITIDFALKVNDNSTYDHPYPIETQADLINACNAEGGDYILLNDIELKSWAPIEAKFDSLDGNGYTIKITSFDLSSIRNQDDVNVGIFSKTNTNTLLKNITVDISNMLKSESTMLNDLNVLKNSTAETYKYLTNIDLAYVSEVNFGILVGENNGSITNAKVVTTKEVTEGFENQEDVYFHIVTTQGYIDDTKAIANIGGLVGVNTETGAISNSFVGLNINGDTIKKTQVVGSSAYNNENDTLEDIKIYPFVLAGGCNIGGLVSENNGIISNSYAKGVGIYNTFPTVSDGVTGGLVATNNNVITSCFVEGSDINGYRAVDNYFKIESTGSVGGLVFTNSTSAKIENSYSNVYLETQSAYSGGFVFENYGTINNSYSTAINKNSLAHGQFTGVKGRVLQNFGEYNNCYYLVLEDEAGNEKEDALAISASDNDLSSTSVWNGFSFVTGVNNDGIWELQEGSAPKISSTLIDTISFRKLTDEHTTLDSNDIIIETVYDYEYVTYNLGSKQNPLIIDKASNFDKYIIDNTSLVGDKRIFGANTSSNSILDDANTVSYVRLVNNLDFSNITTAVKYRDVYLYEIVFAGNLDGNGMSLENLNINTDTTQLENFGLFAQIGVSSSVASVQSVIKNLNITVRSYKSSDSSRSGILAGTIINSSIINVNINANDVTIGGRNFAGALAGVITSDTSVSLIDISIENVVVESTYGSLGGEITAYSKDKSKYFFNQFSVENKETQHEETKSFVSLYDKETETTDLSKSKEVSYAGAVAGAVIANNYSTEIGDGNDYSNYRTKSNSSSIDNIVVKNNITISTADNAGGLFGYVSENTHIKNSKFILNDSQLIKAFNFAGGLVGENYGIIEACSIAYDDSKQGDIDNNIALNEREVSSYYLFDMENSSYYTVAIGGIAGYSHNGVIIDTYSKVNVVKSLSYIAGGIVGYSEGYNYLGYVYNTGLVFGKFVIGGIIGLQVNDYSSASSTIDNYVNMDKVTSLTNWNDTNYRSEIASRLFNNYKNMYIDASGLGYDNFYIKLPEVGNININKYSSADYEVDTDYTDYVLYHDSYYLGSVVGKSMLSISDDFLADSIENGLGDSLSSYEIISSSLINNLYSECNAVFSNTLGLYSYTGSVENGTKNDTYDTSTFTIDIGQEQSFAVKSFRVSYSEESANLNNYEIYYNNDVNSTEYFDLFTFDKVFTAQEYTQQLVGAFTISENSICKSTKNIFKYNFKIDDRYSIGTEGNDTTFINDTDSVWVVNDYLPEITNTISSSIITITNTEELISALTSKSSGKTYYIEPENDNLISVDISSDNKFIEYMSSLRSVFIGKVNEEAIPTIEFNILDSSEISSLFNVLSGSSFANIKFVINYNNSANSLSNKDFANYGLFANSLENVFISNCEFVLNVSGDLLINGETFNSSSIGLLFGNINNSNLSNNIFEINVDSIELNNSKIINFGVLAGEINNSTISNNSFTINVENGLVISKVSDSANIAGVVGLINSTTFEVGTIDVSLNVQDNYDSSKSIAGLVGLSKNSEIDSISNNLEISYINNLNITGTINLSLVAGNTLNSTINDVILSQDSSIEASSSYSIDSLNIGGIVGKDNGNSSIGRKNVVGSSAKINSSVDSNNLAIGGLVGYSTNSYNLIENSYSNSIIIAANNCLGSLTKETKNGETVVTVNYATSFIGGLVGYSNGRIGLKNIYSAGSIELNLSDDVEIDGYVVIKSAIAGVIGGANGVSEIKNFTALTVLSINKDYSNIYISGVIGLNNGVFIGQNGYSYIELPKTVNTQTYSITNNSLSSSCDKVYYTQEFVGNNYDTDSNFVAFSLADLYGEISEFSNIYDLKDSGFEEVSKNTISIYIPLILSDYASGIDTTISSKYDLTKIEDNSITISEDKYYVILTDIDSVSFGSIPTGAIIAGRSTESGKVILTLSSSKNASSTSYVVGANNGVLSNIYLKTHYDNDEALNVALVNENNGVITNCYVYGKSTCSYTLANTNNCSIYQSASSIVIYVNNDADLYGLVNVNNGIISDCYSSSFGYSASSKYVTNVYGFAQTNAGTIQNSFYYIPEIMLYDNVLKGFAKDSTSENAIIKNCAQNTMKPSFVSSRSGVWTEELDSSTNAYHAQIRGFKDIVGSIVLRVYANSQELIEEITIQSLKNDCINGSEIDFSYEITFYQDDLPDYSVVRIANADELISYINSLDNGYIPANTIVLITNDINNVNASLLNSISLNNNAMIIGINSPVISFAEGYSLSKALINTNNGMIANIQFKDLKIDYLDNANGKFAPILSNNGLLYEVNFDNLTLFASNSEYVAGICLSNASSGVIANCVSQYYNISTRKWYCLVCYKNAGSILNSSSLDGIASGSLYPYGVN